MRFVTWYTDYEGCSMQICNLARDSGDMASCPFGKGSCPYIRRRTWHAYATLLFHVDAQISASYSDEEIDARLLGSYNVYFFTLFMGY